MRAGEFSLEAKFLGVRTGTGMMPACAIALVEREVPGFSMDRAELTFGQLGVDSFAMLELRAAVEHSTDQTIPDPIWVDLETPASLLRHLSEALSTTLPGGNGLDPRRRYALNMPQMALGGLSEHWLSKEFRDAHWSMITD